MMRRLLLWTLLLPLFCAGYGVGAQAATCSATFDTIEFGTDINILNGSAKDSAGSVTISCANLSPTESARVCIAVNPNSAALDLASGLDRLKFDFYSDALRTAQWSYPQGVVSVDLNSTNYQSRLSVYGRILAGQNTASVGSYTASIVPNIRYAVYTSGGAQPPCATLSTQITTSITVNATVTATCSISTASMTFPPQTIFTSDVAASSDLTVTCTNAAPYWVGLDNGSNPLSGQRRMKSKSDYINYDLYIDNARQQRWGATKDVDTVSGTGLATGQRITVYGKIPKPTPSPAPGTYTDSVIATVNF